MMMMRDRYQMVEIHSSLFFKLPVDGDHGDGEEGHAHVDVLHQRQEDAKDGLLWEIHPAVQEAVDAPRHHQHAETQIRHR